MGETPEDRVSLPRGSGRRQHSRSVVRAAAAGALVVVVALLSACGGGDPALFFDIGVVVAGQPVSGVVVQPGAAQNVSMSAGQSIELDASEPVQWTLLVGGSAFTGNGATVYYQGVNITITALSPSRIALDTSSVQPLGVAVPVTLTAVSTIDSAQVATVNVLIAN